VSGATPDAALTPWRRDFIDRWLDTPGSRNHASRDYSDEQWELAREVGALLMGDPIDGDPDAPEWPDDEDDLQPILPTSFCFEINWATSGPGIDWPESYCIVALPHRDVKIVVASQPTRDAWDPYRDFAIGWFETARDDVDGLKEAVQAFWRYQAESGAPRARGAVPDE
jgi:hypothetical protein